MVWEVLITSGALDGFRTQELDIVDLESNATGISLRDILNYSERPIRRHVKKVIKWSWFGGENMAWSNLTYPLPIDADADMEARGVQFLD